MKIFGHSSNPLVSQCYHTNRCLCGQVETLEHALVSCPFISPNPNLSTVRKEVSSFLKSKSSVIDPSKFIHPNSLLAALGYLHPKASSRLRKVGVEDVEECLGCIHISLLETSHTIWLARCEEFNKQQHPSSLEERKKAFGNKDFSLQIMLRTRGLSIGNPSLSEEDD